MISLVGFIISATGLPILGVISIAKAGSFQTLAGRVHSSFAIIFPCIVYVFIGPGLGIPRAGSLALKWGQVSYSLKQETDYYCFTQLFSLVLFTG